MQESTRLLIDNKTEAEIMDILVTGYSINRNYSNMVTEASKNMGIALTPDSMARMMKRISNLTGPRTIEGRLRSIANLTNGREKKRKAKFNSKDPNLMLIEDEDEKQFYLLRKESYEADFELNSSSDIGLLNQVLMAEVELFRLRKMYSEYCREIKNNKQTKLSDPSDKIAKKSKELTDLLKSLGADRKTRTGGKDNKGTDVASLATKFERDRDKALQQRAEEKLIEAQNLQDAESQRNRELADLGILGVGFKAKEHTSKKVE